MRIVDAVRRAIEEDAQDMWAAFIPGGCAHHFHVTYRQAPDGFDHDITARLARHGISNRANLTHIERPDGTLRPWLIFKPGDFERRKGPRLGAEFRREHLERLPA